MESDISVLEAKIDKLSKILLEDRKYNKEEFTILNRKVDDFGKKNEANFKEVKTELTGIKIELEDIKTELEKIEKVIEHKAQSDNLKGLR